MVAPLECIKLEDTFQGTKPNGFEIITHDFAPTKVIVEYRYNSVWKNVTRKPLDLVDKD
uniref:RNA-directed DNA polymerase n=1 Tax=Bursaphelenchus xylophilus TaxID=6326 RepID=A0A1I7SNB9_BURXY